jgi:hypothetical protein
VNARAAKRLVEQTHQTLAPVTRCSFQVHLCHHRYDQRVEALGRVEMNNAVVAAFGREVAATPPRPSPASGHPQTPPSDLTTVSVQREEAHGEWRALYWNIRAEQPMECSLRLPPNTPP